MAAVLASSRSQRRAKIPPPPISKRIKSIQDLNLIALGSVPPTTLSLGRPVIKSVKSESASPSWPSLAHYESQHPGQSLDSKTQRSQSYLCLLTLNEDRGGIEEADITAAFNDCLPSPWNATNNPLQKTSLMDYTHANCDRTPYRTPLLRTSDSCVTHQFLDMKADGHTGTQPANPTNHSRRPAARSVSYELDFDITTQYLVDDTPSSHLSPSAEQSEDARGMDVMATTRHLSAPRRS
jgi:hypothetical protein